MPARSGRKHRPASDSSYLCRASYCCFGGGNSGHGIRFRNELAGNDVIVDLTGVANDQTIAITLFGVNDGTGGVNIVVPMSLLLGDTAANGAVNSYRCKSDQIAKRRCS